MLLSFLRTLLKTLVRDNRGFATLNLHTYVSGQEWDSSIPEFWSKRLYDDGIRKAFWGSRFEGKEGSNKPIITKDDFTKGPGDTLKSLGYSNLAICWKTLKLLITYKVKIWEIIQWAISRKDYQMIYVG